MQRVVERQPLASIYKSYYNTHIRQSIGKKPIAKITKVDCQKIMNELADKGKAHSTLTNLKSCMNIVFECALDDEIILKNPVKNIKLPQATRKREERSRSGSSDFYGLCEEQSSIFILHCAKIDIGDADWRNGSIDLE